MKKIIITLLIVVVVASLGIFGYFKIRDIVRANSFFVVDSVHATQPAAFGSGIGERYYFAKDNTYYWNNSDYNTTDTVVAKSGTWQLKGDKLILTESYNLTLEDGSIGKVTAPDGEEVDGLVNYEIVLVETQRQVVKNLEYVGVSQYSQEMIEEKEVSPICYEYTMDGETWFSSTRIEDMPWVDILKEKMGAKEEATEDVETSIQPYEELIANVRIYLENLAVSGETDTDLDISSMFVLDIKNYGYTLLDLNGDNQKELLFFEISDGYWKNILLDIFTIKDNQLEHILSADESSTFVLCDNNRILEYCLEDESRDYNAFYTISSDSTLEFIEKVIYENLTSGENIVERYILEDVEGNESEITMEDADNIYANYTEKEVYLTSFVDIGE